MLDHHHARNKPNKPLSAERLFTAAKDQLGIDEEDEEDPNKDGGDNEAEEDQEDEDVPTTRKRATRNSKSDGIVKPTTVKYYSGTAWKSALIRAKLAFRRYTMLEYLFSLTDTHLEDAELILSKTVADMKNKVTFDLSMYLLSSNTIGNKTQHAHSRFCSN